MYTVASIVLATALLASVVTLAARVRWSAVDVPPWRWGIAFAIGLVVVVYLRMTWIPPHHAMYVDEPWYLEAARNLWQRGSLVLCERSGGAEVCTPYPKASGWPVVLAGAFALFGGGSQVAFAVAAVLSAWAIILAAQVTRLAGGEWHHCAMAALLVAVHPLHVAWSATAETNTAATAIVLAGMAGVLLLRRTPSLAHAALAGAGLGLATAMRPETAMVLPPVMLVLARAGCRRRDLAIVALGAVLGTTSVVASWSLYLANSSGTFLSPANLGPNFVRLLAVEEGGAVTLAIVALAIIGGIAALRRGAAPIVMLFGGGAVLIALVVLGYDRRIFYPRTALGPLVLLAPLAALALPSHGRGRLARAAAAGASILLIALAIPGWQRVGVVSVTQLLQTRLSQALGATSLPADAVIIAEWPTVVSAESDRIAVPARELIGRDGAVAAAARGERAHFLLCDMFCEPALPSAGTSACAQLLDTFAFAEVFSVTDDHRRYGLYRIVGHAGPGSLRPRCPLQ